MDYLQRIEKLKNILNEGNVVFFGGAGVSTESGIPDFRSQDGLYRSEYAYPPEQIVSHSFFMSATEEFYRFYKNRMLYLDAQPNACHVGLASLERAGLLNAIVTQNIDGLHQSAGSKKVYELHGSVWRNYCMRCNRPYDTVLVKNAVGVPTCECGGIIKPDVVLYEEELDNSIVTGAVQAIARANTLIVGGTSLVVYPAAGLIDYFHGKHLVVINRTPTSADEKAELLFTEDIGRVFSDAVIHAK